jgi:hypothetical protein
MRVATRRPDGAWDFSVPSTPINPFLGTNELEPVAKPQPARTKEALAKIKTLPSRGYLDPDALPVPPPAYSPQDERP